MVITVHPTFDQLLFPSLLMTSNCLDRIKPKFYLIDRNFIEVHVRLIFFYKRLFYHPRNLSQGGRACPFFMAYNSGLMTFHCSPNFQLATFLAGLEEIDNRVHASHISLVEIAKVYNAD